MGSKLSVEEVLSNLERRAVIDARTASDVLRRLLA